MGVTSSPTEPRVLLPDVEEPDISHIVTEDDEPVDSIYSEKQQRLLVEPLYASWEGPPVEDPGEAPRKFLASANVGLFPGVHVPPLVPDAFVSLDVEPRPPLFEKRNRTYFFWEFGKPPEIVIEVVSNRVGQELGDKLARYVRMGIDYYVVWDPAAHLGDVPLHVFEKRGSRYEPRTSSSFEPLGLGLVTWTGPYEGGESIWLRWCRLDGSLIATGAEIARAERERADAEQERADTEQERADTERERADTERERADAERERAERLAEQLRKLGVDPG